MKISDLKPGDLILSRKHVSFWQHPVQWFFHWRVKCNSKRIYGPNCEYPYMNHARRVTKVDIPWFFHWTFPCSHFGTVKPWMLDPEYALVFRRKEEIIPSAELWDNLFVEFAGDLYNLGKLFDIEFGFKRFFSFGRKLYVCSSGQRMVEEFLLGIDNIFPEVPLDKTPPCSWANHPERYECVNLEEGMPETLQYEPQDSHRIFRKEHLGVVVT